MEVKVGREKNSSLNSHFVSYPFVPVIAVSGVVGLNLTIFGDGNFNMFRREAGKLRQIWSKVN